MNYLYPYRQGSLRWDSCQTFYLRMIVAMVTGMTAQVLIPRSLVKVIGERVQIWDVNDSNKPVILQQVTHCTDGVNGSDFRISRISALIILIVYLDWVIVFIVLVVLIILIMNFIVVMILIVLILNLLMVALIVILMIQMKLLILQARLMQEVRSLRITPTTWCC